MLSSKPKAKSKSKDSKHESSGKSSSRHRSEWETPSDWAWENERFRWERFRDNRKGKRQWQYDEKSGLKKKPRNRDAFVSTVEASNLELKDRLIEPVNESEEDEEEDDDDDEIEAPTSFPPDVYDLEAESEKIRGLKLEGERIPIEPQPFLQTKFAQVPPNYGSPEVSYTLETQEGHEAIEERVPDSQQRFRIAKLPLATSNNYNTKEVSKPQGRRQSYSSTEYTAKVGANYHRSGNNYISEASNHNERNTPPTDNSTHQRSVSAYQTTNDHLDDRFRVHSSNKFTYGKIFKVLWSEPQGAHGTNISQETRAIGAKYGEKAYHKVRRFVVVSNMAGHSLCLSIMTYGSQATLKKGVHAETHAQIYSGSSNKHRPDLRKNERLTKKAIRTKPIGKDQKLDPLSRLNYAKVYTVEHNVKVFFVGQLSGSSKQEVVATYNATHGPLPNVESFSSGDDDDEEDEEEETIEGQSSYTAKPRRPSHGSRQKSQNMLQSSSNRLHSTSGQEMPLHAGPPNGTPRYVDTPAYPRTFEASHQSTMPQSVNGPIPHNLSNTGGQFSYTPEQVQWSPSTSYVQQYAEYTGNWQNNSGFNQHQQSNNPLPNLPTSQQHPSYSYASRHPDEYYALSEPNPPQQSDDYQEQPHVHDPSLYES